MTKNKNCGIVFVGKKTKSKLGEWEKMNVEFILVFMAVQICVAMLYFAKQWDELYNEIEMLKKEVKSL